MKGIFNKLLDMFGARYYSNPFGRFMTPDWEAKPTTIPYAKFGDPQTLNLYSYVENGPLNKADLDGHDLTVVGDEKKRYINDLEKASGLNLKAGKSGKLTITRTPDKLSAVGKEIQKIIQDKSNHVHVSALTDDPHVIGGSFNGNGNQTLNFKSIDEISGKGGFSETSIVVHETTEAYAGTMNGGDYAKSHAVGIEFENAQRLSEGLSARIGETSTPTATGAHAEINFSIRKESFDVDRVSGEVSNMNVQRTNAPDPITGQ